MSDHLPVIWIIGDAQARARRQPLLDGLAIHHACLFLGSQPEDDLNLGPEPDLSLALESCPAELRPRACLWLGQDQAAPPAGLASLPCPVLGLEAPGPEGRLPGDPGEALARLAQALEGAFSLPWMAHVQVNVPLRDLLGRYGHLLGSHPINPEVGIDYLALDSLGPADLARAKGILAGRRVSVHLPFGDLVPGSPDPLVAAVASGRLMAAGRWALELGAARAVAHLGHEHRMHPDFALYAQRTAQNLAPLARLLADGGCRLVLENTFELEPTPLALARQALARESGVEVGYCLDVGHASCFSASDLPTWWEALWPHLGEMHLHDNDGHGDQHLPPGRGRVDWAYLARQLPRLERPPLLTLEPHAEGHLWASLRALRALWGAPGAWPGIDGQPGQPLS